MCENNLAEFANFELFAVWFWYTYRFIWKAYIKIIYSIGLE